MTENSAGVAGIAPCGMCGYEPTQRIANCPRCGRPLIGPGAVPATASTLPAAATATATSAPATASPLPTAPAPNPGQTVRRSTLGQMPASPSPYSTTPPPSTPAPFPPSSPTPHLPSEPPAYPAPTGVHATEPDGGRPADLGRRFAAHLIDGALLGAVFVVLYLVLMIVLFAGSATGSSAVTNIVGAVVFLGYLAMLALSVVYSVRGIGVLGQTIGKSVLGLKVVDADSHQSIGSGRAFTRSLLLALMGMPCYLGYLTILLDKSGWGRGWHDTTARSVVVSVPPVPFGRSVRAVLAALRGRAR